MTNKHLKGTHHEGGKDRNRILRYLRTLLDKAQDELDSGVEKPRITPSQALAAARQLERVGEMDEPETEPAGDPEPKPEKESTLREVSRNYMELQRRKKGKRGKKNKRPIPSEVESPNPPMLE